jgi:hypothetical protein
LAINHIYDAINLDKFCAVSKHGKGLMLSCAAIDPILAHVSGNRVYQNAFSEIANRSTQTNASGLA